jgi:hypothetical protein
MLCCGSSAGFTTRPTRPWPRAAGCRGAAEGLKYNITYYVYFKGYTVRALNSVKTDLKLTGK